MRNRMTNTLIAVLGAGIALTTIGCDSAIDEATPEPGTGTLVQAWTIEGEKSPARCDELGATQMRIALYDATETVYATQISPCETFSLTRVVRAQPYRGIATFFDAAGNPVSETVDLGEFEVFANTTTTIEQDFSRALLGR